MESKVDVLVIGAGPAGLMCANALAQAGVRVRIIDLKPEKVATGQADGIQPRTTEVLQSYGLAERLLREGCHLHLAAFYNPGPDGGIVRTARAADVSWPICRYPFKVALHQGAIESMFTDSIGSMGVDVERPVLPTSIEISEDQKALKDFKSHPVTVTLSRLETNDTSTIETVHAKFVVGADGAHSWVDAEYIWGVIDFVPTTNFPDIRAQCAIHSTRGSAMIVPREDDKVRIYIQLEDEDVLDEDTGRVDRRKMSPGKMLDVARKISQPYTFEDPSEFDWWTVYIIGQRVASQFSVHERVFIAGDACHTHSPKAGQGMNAGINDSHNLAWKLAYVLRGHASLNLLKTYEIERRKYAQDLIEFDKKWSSLYSGKPQTAYNAGGVTHGQFVKAQSEFEGFTSGANICYAASQLVNTANQPFAIGVIIGQRMRPHRVVCAADMRPYELQDLLPSDTRFKIVVFAGDTSRDAQMDRVHSLEKTMTRGLLRRANLAGAIDVLTIASTDRDTFNYMDLPAVFRSHWSKVLIDGPDMRGQLEGQGTYKDLGIHSDGAIAVIRPDGYIGAVIPLDELQGLDDYFTSVLDGPNLCE